MPFVFINFWGYFTTAFPTWFAVTCLAVISFCFLLLIFKIVAFVFDVIPFL